VRWDRAPETGAFQLNWRESGGPKAAAPTRRGFGLRLIERALAGERHAKTELRFSRAGLACAITATLRDGAPSSGGPS
jgi:two-component sensor histidine kinase